MTGWRFPLALLALSTRALAAQPLAGAWQCQTAEGAASLTFLDASRLNYNGTESRYSVQGNILWVLVNGAPAAYRFRRSGKRLDIDAPEGGQIKCSHTALASPAPGASGKQEKITDGNLNHLLQGMLCSWSGSSGGGSSYSTSTRVSFDGNGNFATGAESSFSGNSGGYAGRRNGHGGAYRVIAVRVGAPVELLWNSGARDMAYVSFVYGGRITELKYGKQVFGATLCN